MKAMRSYWLLALLLSSIPTFALRGAMEKATVHAMRKVPCMETQSTGRGGILAGLAGAGDGVNECIEYELRTEKVSYIIRPHRAVLLLLGGDVSIKFADSELLLRVNDGGKDIRCSVVAMSLRTDAEKREKAHLRSCYAESGREVACPEDPDR